MKQWFQIIFYSVVKLWEKKSNIKLEKKENFRKNFLISIPLLTGTYWPTEKIKGLCSEA